MAERGFDINIPSDAGGGSIELQNHYKEPLNDLVELRALSFSTLNDKERHYVESENSDYFWDSEATSGDEIANDNITIGFWIKEVDDVQSQLDGKFTISNNLSEGDPVTIKVNIGLDNIDNTSDANKPISTLTQTALDLKADDFLVLHTTGNEDKEGVLTFNNSAASLVNGIELINSGAFASSVLEIYNTGGGKGILGVNTSTGQLIYFDNTSTGTGISFANQGSGSGIQSNNQGSGSGFISINQSNGTGIKSSINGSGNGISSEASGTGTGLLYEGKNVGLVTFSVTKEGAVNANSFIKAGGISTQSLMADGSTSESTNLSVEQVGENVAIGDILYLKADGKFWKASNTSYALVSGSLRIATEVILTDASGLVASNNTKAVIPTTAIAIGAIAYMGATGSIISEADRDLLPTGSFSRRVGVVYNATTLYFNPIGDTYEI
jgi:hypothetical protein